MTADIDRQKLRELCERRNEARKSRSLGGMAHDTELADAVLPLLNLTDAQAAKLDNLSRSLVHANTCLDGYASTHEKLLTLCEPACGRDLPIPDRVERLARLHKEQAAKIAELEAENASLRERADAPEDRTWFWEIADRDGLANVASDERQALADLCRAAAERDQLRKQGEGQFVAGMRGAVNVIKGIVIWDGPDADAQENAFNEASSAILSAASALEQKGQG